ncbi:MAG: GNAT family N-acetyltransferase, partial [Granulosicoccaceae bacterium]
VVVQPCNGDGLLRSLVVSERARGAGIGRDLVYMACQHAEHVGLRSLWLLTETAETFFKQQGFSLRDRQSAPTDILASAQFASLCPQTSHCLSIDCAA